MLIQTRLCAQSFVLGEPECGKRAHLATVNDIRMQSKSVNSKLSEVLLRETQFLLDFVRKIDIREFRSDIRQVDERERRHHQPEKLAKQPVLRLKQDIIDGGFFHLGGKRCGNERRNLTRTEVQKRTMRCHSGLIGEQLR